LAVENLFERSGPSDKGGELFARKGRANARGFGTGTVDAVAAAVARTAHPSLAIDLGRATSDASVPIHRKRFRALVADGDPLSRKLYRDLLEADGYDVMLANDGIEALEAIRRHSPDIAVVNLRLAELSGLEVARRINDDDGRDGFGGIPVVSGAEMFRAGDEADSRAGGCAAYLAKPISIRNFLDTIDQLMQPAARSDPD